MAPGCLSNVQLNNSLQTDTIDSFEILEQTVMKQKRLAKKKKCDLRLRILLKRTFDLVCEIMDRENGFNEDLIDNSNNNSSNINNDYSNYSEQQQHHHQQQQNQEEESAIETTTSNETSSFTITMSKIDIESIPLPDDTMNINSRFEDDYNNIQLVPDELKENLYKFENDNNKEYHLLTNVNNENYYKKEEKINKKRKCYDDENNFIYNNKNNNKKLKLVDIVHGTKVTKNEV